MKDSGLNSGPEKSSKEVMAGSIFFLFNSNRLTNTENQMLFIQHVPGIG